MSILLERLKEAMDSHDAVQMASLFAEDYRSASPAHPRRAFRGRAAAWVAEVIA